MARRTPKPDWHPEDVKAALRKVGQTLSGLSQSNGYSTSTVGCVLRRPAAGVQAVIAAVLKMKPQDIWPSRYHADGTPRRRGQYSRPHAAAQRQNGKAR